MLNSKFGGFQLVMGGYSNSWMVHTGKFHETQDTQKKTGNHLVGSRNGGSPIAGWFLREIPSFEMDDDWRYPHGYGNPHLGVKHVDSPGRSLGLMLWGIHDFLSPIDTWRFPES